MKLLINTTILCSLCLLISGCESGSITTKTVKLETTRDSVSYFIGTDISRSLKEIKDEINLEILISGLKDQVNDRPLRVQRDEIEPAMRMFSVVIRNKREEKNKAVATTNLEEGKMFLTENKKKEGVTTTESGLQYMVLTPGPGPMPKKTDKVKVHYRGTTINGNEFDSSYKRGKPTSFPVTGVIKGWTEALLLMNVGSKYRLFIPPELAYGERGAGPDIGPNAVLIFDVELLGIEN